MLATLQDSFAQALLDPERPLPAAITSRHADIPERRFAVYRNNVVVGLVCAMRTGFPVVETIVGEEFFAAMARCYVIAHPPRSPLLLRYGEDFGTFISQFPPAAELAYLADVARLEYARRRAYHAADAAPADPARLAALDPAALPGLRVSLHPSFSILRSHHPVVTIWAMNSGQRELASIDENCHEDALVVRKGFDVTVQSLPPGGAEFLLALEAGQPLGAAAEGALADRPDFDLAANLAGLINAGVMTDFTISGEHA